MKRRPFRWKPAAPHRSLRQSGSASVSALTLALLLAFPLSALWQRLTRDTSSHAAAEHGAKAYRRKDYGTAVAAFAKANALAPSPMLGFDLGTAQIAAGKHEEGSATLTRALADPQLRADALYNRGNSALASNAYDYAIRDYSETLRLRPNDVSAKRNLEIAMARKQAAEQSRAKQQKENGGGKQGPKQPTPGSGKQNEQQPKSDPNVEAMLRAVQQQEQEELSRMNHARTEKVRVGW